LGRGQRREEKKRQREKEKERARKGYAIYREEEGGCNDCNLFAGKVP